MTILLEAPVLAPEWSRPPTADRRPPPPEPLTHAEAGAFSGPDVPTLACAGRLVPVKITPHLTRYRCQECRAELTLKGGVVVGVDYRPTVRLLAERLSFRREAKPEPPEYVLLGREDDRYRKAWD